MSDTEQKGQDSPVLTTPEERRAAKDQAGSRSEPRFSRERLLSDDGPRIAGHPHHVIVGALHGEDTAEYTRAQIAQRIDRWHEREVEQEG